MTGIFIFWILPSLSEGRVLELFPYDGIHLKGVCIIFFGHMKLHSLWKIKNMLDLVNFVKKRLRVRYTRNRLSCSW